MPAKIKFCGIMRPQDARTAARSGASYLGVVFAGGPRVVSRGRAREVVDAADGLPVIGVFGNQPPEEILETVRQSGLCGAQLHGPYVSKDAAFLQAADLVVWRVVRIAVPFDLDSIGLAVSDSDAVVVEPRVAHVGGGAGVPLDLAIAREARCRLAGHPMVLAGGLTPDTVRVALDFVRPDIVDVCSGVERLPGIKDPQKIARFVEEVLAHSPVN